MFCFVKMYWKGEVGIVKEILSEFLINDPEGEMN